MSDAVQLKLVENLPAILTALGIIFTAYFTYRNGRKLETNTQATEAIKQSVDGKASSDAERMKSLEREIQLLRDHGKDKDTQAALLAQAAAVVRSGAGAPSMRPSRASDAPAKVEVVNTPEVVVSNTPLLVKGDEGDEDDANGDA